jgi:hypothetical protein
MVEENVFMNNNAALPDAFALPFPFGAVDAVMHEITRSDQVTLGGTVKFRRVTLTGASVEYRATIRAPDGSRGSPAKLFVCMINDHVTRIHPLLLPDLPERTHVALRGFLDSIVGATWEHLRKWNAEGQDLLKTRQQEKVLNLDQGIQQLASVFPRAEKTIGRPVAELNEWARQEIASGRNREEVFNEYLERQDVDEDDEFKLEKARDRFRKAIRRKEGNK